MNATRTLETQCPMCETLATITVPFAGYEKWKRGGLLIQDAMPELSIKKREQVMTGICALCWEKWIKPSENG